MQGELVVHIPGEINLFSQTWTIRPGSDLELNMNNGLCIADRCEILFNANQTWDSCIHTVMHELIHAIEIKLDLDLTERQVDVMALALIHLFRQNPELEVLLDGQA